MDKKYSRRKFLYKNILGTATLVGGGWLMASCKLAATAIPGEMNETAQNGQKAAAQNSPQPAQNTPKGAAQQTPITGQNPCDDLTGVVPGEIEKRKKFAYVGVSPIPDNRCGNCKLFLPPGAGKACGGCLLFKGPVRETGYCTYWAPIE
ncbi:hypothetical protein AAE02nite_24200 [Adhaeribacter aerolatus]|uniref:High potential iron-sulfur proteins family profile domain-containing protein n=1 Tax=Adhaeribacter aerolatus TaxID=670289 RepID=A0A512AYH4_9BACT|nr:high-potential iron-sulfur protein [Adhaeribacter aerolatus]GEO04756.1 hypothetical protein AAE02nite_24200 [Adhaeribacter aerolatus]